MSNNKISFLDLVTPHREIEEEVVAVVRKALGTAGFIGGPMLEAFEKEFAAFCTTGDAVGVANGTDALRFALMAAGVKAGDIVLTVPMTFIATTEAISQAGARLDFVDVDERTLNMSPDRLREYIDTRCVTDPATGRLRHRQSGQPVTAVVPVHLYGQMADMDPILDLADQHKLLVIEDACQAHGAEYFSKRSNSWVRAGSVGVAAAFSFYPGKNLGACGEAGAVTTSDPNIAKRVRMLRDHGQIRKYYHLVEGYNGRLDAIQAGILSVKLRRLADGNRKRQEHAARYLDLLASVASQATLPFTPAASRPVYHLYVIRVRDRASVQQQLEQAGVGTGIHYPVPVHLQDAYKSFGFQPGDFPVTEKAADEVLSLPMFPELEPAQQERVAAALTDALMQVVRGPSHSTAR